ncbi:MAG: hypothetical protein JHC93_07860 [Parachlamydiales bacterium]|nr:hypothetical protein [Parachlamydiales bacterium]
MRCKLRSDNLLLFFRSIVTNFNSAENHVLENGTEEVLNEHLNCSHKLELIAGSIICFDEDHAHTTNIYDRLLQLCEIGNTSYIKTAPYRGCNNMAICGHKIYTADYFGINVLDFDI